ncbi:hypothetical protein NLX86_13995 [Streptomyces sp. A3M-1-3]|uniref:hypothetical protein n=1 Tax=Streptomyces sp. A3M-1-3 TaxID=2962044 RepID=UPI0020B6EB09|nr:hypothetical protein [Streptomyces sp. A3M-1-3]MCP3819179.1 hypothetical protein [Streptomyces sp. A3M-1-3]
MTQNAMIPGVVDGTVTPSVDAEGNVSLHIVIRDVGSRSQGNDYIEIVLTGSDARELLSAPVPGKAASVPCSVGVRLQPGPSFASAL